MDKLIALRKENKLSQKELASHVGITQQALQKYESGKATPSTCVIRKIASFFGVPVDYLLDSRYPAYNKITNTYLVLSKDEYDTIISIRSLKQDDRDYIHSMISLAVDHLNKVKENKKHEEDT